MEVIKNASILIEYENIVLHIFLSYVTGILGEIAI